LLCACQPYHLIHEPDLSDSGSVAPDGRAVPPGQFTAIGLPLVTDRKPLKRLLGRLPLWSPA